MSKWVIIRILFLMLISFRSYSQKEVPILSDSLLVRGIYRTFQEFKQNKPSIILDVQAEEAEVDYDWTETHILYRMNLEEGVKVKRRDVWGFSDGDFVYIKVNNGLINQYYAKIEYFGRYCYYEVVEGGSSGMVMSNPNGGPGTPIPPSAPGLYGKILNINNGKEYYLEPNLEMILSNDPELLAEYKSGNREGRENFRYLIVRYCEKHPEELK